MYSVEMIRRLEELENLAPEWTDLCRADPRATPFQTPEWASAWWRHRGRGRLHCIAVRHAGRLVGLGPLYVSRRQFPPLRRLAFLGTGKSDYLDVTVDPTYGEEVVPRVFQELWASRSDWDYLDLQQLRCASNAMEFSQIDSGRASEHPHSTCPYLPLAGLDGMDGIPLRHLKNVRYSHRRLSKTGVIRYRIASQSTLEADLDAFFRLHQSRWRSRGMPGVFRGGGIQAFHREAAAGFLEKGILRLHVLERNGEILAVALVYVMHGRAFYYGGGFDPKWASYSPGSLAIGEAIRSAAAEGCVEFDFLRGEEAYKRLWGCRTRRNLRLIAATNPVAGKIAHRLPSLEARLEREGLRALGHYLRLRR